MPGFPVLHYLPEFAQTHVHWFSDTIHSFHAPLPPSPPAFSLSQHQGLFQWVGSSHQVAKYWSFSISPSNKYSGLVPFRIDWLHLLAVQGTLKSLLQHHSSKASILQRSAFFMFQLSHPYMTTGKTIALKRRTLVIKAISLLFNILSRLVIAFLSRSECLLTSWLQSLSALILEPMKICHCFHVSPICHEGLDAMILAFVMLTCKLLSFFGFWPQGMWDFSSPTRDWTSTPCIGSLTMRPPGKPHTPQTF